MQLWFGAVYMVNMQMSFLSQPFGYSLFYLKSVAPPQITMGIIFRSALPFIALPAFGIVICVLFPDKILWLTGQDYGELPGGCLRVRSEVCVVGHGGVGRYEHRCGRVA